MSTTIVETPVRVLKLTDGNRKIISKPVQTCAQKLSSFHDLLEASERVRKDLLPFTQRVDMHNAIDSVAHSLRDPIADIQEKRGVSKNQQYSFIELMMSLLQQSYNACLCIITMIFGLLPLMEGLLTLCRFVLDKVIEINNTDGVAEKVFKCLIFLVELFIIFILVMIIISIILLPVFHLLEYNCHKVWSVISN